jgi:hypothetical protein
MGQVLKGEALATPQIAASVASSLLLCAVALWVVSRRLRAAALK